MNYVTGDGSWFEVGVETITTRPPADALSISREALFDDCLEKVGRKALNRSAKFISVTFTHTGLSTSQKSKKRKENATDEGGLTSELFTLFFEGVMYITPASYGNLICVIFSYLKLAFVSTKTLPRFCASNQTSLPCFSQIGRAHV